MRILIATVTAGGGHLAAAAALDEAWRSLRSHDVIGLSASPFFVATCSQKVSGTHLF